MPVDFTSTLFIVVSFALTFLVARALSRWWRSRQRSKAEAQGRAAESRQVRRARERSAR